jgi:DNA-directed RNA polymerase subunit M/transcription elongation factor TFIIS
MPVTTITNPDIFRINVRKRLNETLKDEKHSTNLEKGIYNYSLKEADTRKVVKKWDNKYFVQIYVDHLRSVYNNLKPEIIEQIVDGSIKAHSVAFMTHQELSPEKWGELIDAKSKRDKNKFEVNIEAATDTFTCRKCKSKKCSFYLQQIRSSDEPTTIFVQCLECGQRWKTC